MWMPDRRIPGLRQYGRGSRADRSGVVFAGEGVVPGPRPPGRGRGAGRGDVRDPAAAGGGHGRQGGGGRGAVRLVRRRRGVRAEPGPAPARPDAARARPDHRRARPIPPCDEFLPHHAGAVRPIVPYVIAGADREPVARRSCLRALERRRHQHRIRLSHRGSLYRPPRARHRLHRPSLPTRWQVVAIHHRPLLPGCLPVPTSTGRFADAPRGVMGGPRGVALNQACSLRAPPNLTDADFRNIEGDWSSAWDCVR